MLKIIMTVEERLTVLAKIKVGSAVYWKKSNKLDVISSYEIRHDKLGFNYCVLGYPVQKSVHFSLADEILILTEQEIPLLCVLFQE